MEWRGILCSLFFIISMGESSSRFGIMWLPNLGVDTGKSFSWPILSASVFVVVAIVLPMYLIFEHLTAYNQPEVCYQLPKRSNHSVFRVLSLVINDTASSV